MLTKDEMLSEVRRVAQERGGRVGLTSFLKTTGIPKTQVLGKRWVTWNEVLTDAGLATAGFRRPRTDENLILEAVASLIQRLKKWPTENELLLERQRNRSFPSLNVIRRLRKSGNLPRILVAHCTNRPDLDDAAKIAAHQETFFSCGIAATGVPSRRYVYMIRSGRYYKIDHTVSPHYRRRELRSDIPEAKKLVHAIETDDPCGIAAYWRRRFESKQVDNTGLFALDVSDVAAFRLRRYQ